ncbi:MAG TPA: hypothetical protein QF423_04665, partial [Candidatus Scalindua sp.]|nr:hypothetical protein [Candidatus Scalindua sp.]
GGVLLALPALLMNGLLKFTKALFELPKGYYDLIHIFLVLSFMGLLRVKNIEQLRYYPPGEWGKVPGLDRIPEAKPLRRKVSLLADERSVKEWGGQLAQYWMDKEPESSGVLYVDGHVRVYHGSKTKLPRRYVARQKLAMRGVTDYWVNDGLGRPFFVISSPLTDGLQKVLFNDIVPQLLHDVPGQPDEAELKNNPYCSRFVIVFDREGYSPELFCEMWKNRIACQTYRKYKYSLWSDTEFKTYSVKMPHGEIVTMELAEQGWFMGSKIWVREIRKKGKNGHQTSVLSTDYEGEITSIAAHMFARWSQENFFKYMMVNYDLDGLTGYNLSPVDETKNVVNPDYRKLEGQIKSAAAKLANRKVKLSEIFLKEDNLTDKEIGKYKRKKGDLLEEVEQLSQELDSLKSTRKETPKHIPLRQLPKEEQFHRIAPLRKQFLDTVKMIAYRSETAMAQYLHGILGRKDDARPLLRNLYKMSVDLDPDEANKTLTVKVHHFANPQSNRIIQKLCDELTLTETIYPGTNLTLIYKMVSK